MGRASLVLLGGLRQIGKTALARTSVPDSISQSIGYDLEAGHEPEMLDVTCDNRLAQFQGGCGDPEVMVAHLPS